MSSFPIHTLDSAPERAKPALRDLLQTFGVVPNLAATMAESPALLDAFVSLFHKVHAGSFTEAQLQTLLLSNAVANRCSWAVAFHSTLALKEGVAPTDVEAIRQRRAPREPQQAALSALTQTLIEKRGHLDSDDLGKFQNAGFRRDQVLEVLTVLAASTLTNYAGNTTNPALEAQFQPQAWSA